jgi:AcrR family transcriptional regulator
MVLDTVIRLEVSKGHLSWKITDLSRLSGVGRPLIYYYFGKAKEEIVRTALKIIADEIFGLSPERIEMWKRGQIAESVLKTRELMARAPHVSQFYFHWRHRPGDISSYFKEVEKRYRAKLGRLLNRKSPAEVEALFAVFFGLILIPELNEATLRLAIAKLNL